MMKSTCILLFFIEVLCLGSTWAQVDTLQRARINAINQDIRKQFAPDRRNKTWLVEAQERGGFWSITGYTTEPGARDVFLQLLRENSIPARDSIEILPAAQPGNKIFGLANVSVSNNRYEPRQAAEMATQMTLGMPLEILKKQGGYLLVRTPDHYISWTEDLMVAPMTRAELSAWNQSKRLVYTAYFGHAYALPDASSAIVSDLVSGNIVKFIGHKKGYYAIAFPDGRQAYIPLTTAIPFDQWLRSRHPSVDIVEKNARVMMGTPYLWGGTSLKGVDCSGFIKTSYFLEGIILPRDASQQAGIGEVVNILDHDTVSVAMALMNLKRGDLLFFSALKDGKPVGRVTHVAMYIAEGKFIHASGLVRVNSMRKGDPEYADWESRALVSARRVSGIKGDSGIVAVSEHPLYMK